MKLLKNQDLEFPVSNFKNDVNDAFDRIERGCLLNENAASAIKEVVKTLTDYQSYWTRLGGFTQYRILFLEFLVPVLAIVGGYIYGVNNFLYLWGIKSQILCA